MRIFRGKVKLCVLKIKDFLITSLITILIIAYVVALLLWPSQLEKILKSYPNIVQSSGSLATILATLVALYLGLREAKPRLDLELIPRENQWPHKLRIINAGRMNVNIAYVYACTSPIARFLDKNLKNQYSMYDHGQIKNLNKALGYGEAYYSEILNKELLELIKHPSLILKIFPIRIYVETIEGYKYSTKLDKSYFNS